MASQVRNGGKRLTKSQMQRVKGGATDGTTTTTGATDTTVTDDSKTAGSSGGGSGQIYLKFQFKLVAVKTVSWS